jgi:hypothetical protein
MAENHVQPIATAKASARMECASAILNTVVWIVRKVSARYFVVVMGFTEAVNVTVLTAGKDLNVTLEPLSV